MRAGSIEDDRSEESTADDIELIEMANLSTAQTGVDGVIHISTAQGKHGPRVNWYPGPPSKNGPCLSATIERNPKVFNHFLPQPAFASGSAAVGRWVGLNFVALLDFWNHGTAWLDDEVTAFKRGLQKLG